MSVFTETFTKRMKATANKTKAGVITNYSVHLPAAVTPLMKEFDVTHFDVFVNDDGILMKPVSDHSEPVKDVQKLDQNWRPAS